LLIAVLVVSLIVPFVWLLRGRMDFGQGTWFGLVIGWILLLGGRWWLGIWQTGDWAFTPLLSPPWWVVLLGAGLGTAVVLFYHKKINGTELGATISSGLVVLIGVFIMMFSRVGFLQF
jgi:FtsH-binding integral membrane protein